VVYDVDPDEIWGYWGQVNDTTKKGSYRATCVRLGPHSDTRLNCNVAFNFDDKSSLIAQGLLDRPAPGAGLFAAASPRKLAITGGTAPDYEAKQGYADPKGTDPQGKVTIALRVE
jgi:hypothetical protein